MVLTMISGVLVLLFAVLAINEFYTPRLVENSYDRFLSKGVGAADQELSSRTEGILNKMAEIKKAARDFWLQFAQLVLLNLLLPVLTAILGYVFGSKQGSRET